MSTFEKSHRTSRTTFRNIINKNIPILEQLKLLNEYAVEWHVICQQLVADHATKPTIEENLDGVLFEEVVACSL